MIYFQGLQAATKTSGDPPAGTKMYVLVSDTKITDDIDLILDFSDLPVYDQTWSADDTQLRVRRKSAEAMGEVDGYAWQVEVRYESPEGNSTQDDLDPRERDWDWSKGPSKKQIVVTSSRFNTTGHVYPGSDLTQNVWLGSGVAIQNTNGLPPAEGVQANRSQQAITLTKYVDDYSDLGLSSWDELDAYVDTLNHAEVILLDSTYKKWELYMDEINYRPASENGYDVIRVDLRIIADRSYTHLYVFPSSGYKELVDSTTLQDIPDSKGGVVTEPRLLDEVGKAIPVTDGTLIEPYYVAAANQDQSDWSQIDLPAAIP